MPPTAVWPAGGAARRRRGPPAAGRELGAAGGAGPKPRAMDVTKPYEFIGFGDIQKPQTTDQQLLTQIPATISKIKSSRGAIGKASALEDHQIG